jgi:hypothetical protein
MMLSPAIQDWSPHPYFCCFSSTTTTRKRGVSHTKALKTESRIRMPNGDQTSENKTKKGYKTIRYQ